MLENYNRYKLLKIFFFNPLESFRLRELSRLSGISPPSVMSYLHDFESKSLIRKYKKRGIPFYKAEIDNEKFKEYKKLSILFELNHSGVLDFLWEELSPESIILYGSYARGESVGGSDVDMFIIGKEKKLNLDKFERKIGKKFHLFFEKDVKKIPKELKNNLINGIVLRGYLKLF